MALATFPAIRSPKTFDRHIKRLVWCALIGSIALLIPFADNAPWAPSGLIGGLGAIVITIASLAVVRDVSRYVRYEAARRAEAARRSSRIGACQAAEVIQDRVANLLSVTVGYADFLSEDEHLPSEARENAQRALDSALAAARAVTAFRFSLGCGPSSLRRLDELFQLSPTADQTGADSWRYDETSRSINTRDGRAVAVLSRAANEVDEVRTGRLIAQAPLLREALGETQHLLATLLTSPARGAEETARLQVALERINATLDRVED